VQRRTRKRGSTTRREYEDGGSGGENSRGLQRESSVWPSSVQTPMVSVYLLILLPITGENGHST